jgi:sortase A
MSLVKKIGIILLILGFGIVLVQYSGVIKAELGYQVDRINGKEKKEIVMEKDYGLADKKQYIFPKDKEFGLIIPKLGINVSVIPQVSPFNSREYQQALSQGVAHAKDTKLPSQKGNTVIFAHSTDNFYNANKYNAVFYLLNKLEKGDKAYIVYNNKLYPYKVLEKSVVEEDKINYMEASEEQKLTLITCWPPGTRQKRLVVVAD